MSEEFVDKSWDERIQAAQEEYDRARRARWIRDNVVVLAASREYDDPFDIVDDAKILWDELVKAGVDQ